MKTMTLLTLLSFCFFNEGTGLISIDLSENDNIILNNTIKSFNEKEKPSPQKKACLVNGKFILIDVYKIDVSNSVLIEKKITTNCPDNIKLYSEKSKLNIVRYYIFGRNFLNNISEILPEKNSRSIQSAIKKEKCHIFFDEDDGSVAKLHVYDFQSLGEGLMDWCGM